MARVLVVYGGYATTTGRIARRVTERLRTQGCEVDLRAAADVGPRADLGSYDAVVVGAGWRSGHQHPAMARFVREHVAALEAVPSLYFGVGMVAARLASSGLAGLLAVEGALDAVAGATGWRPRWARAFGGDCSHPLARAGRWLVGGLGSLRGLPARPADLPDWDAVDRFGDEAAAAVARRAPAA